jgi:hypothetical protein
MWTVGVRILPRSTASGTGDWTYNDMDLALNRFMNEVAATVKHATQGTTPTGYMAGMYQEFIIDREEAEAAFRNYLMGDVDKCIEPALVLKEMVRTDLASWLHTLAWTEGKA